jgi:ribosome-associated protein
LEIHELLRAIVEAAESKKANDLIVLDLKGIANFTDYFVICDGSSNRQVRAIYGAVMEELEKLGAPPDHVEGEAHGQWILIDCTDIVIHVFRRDRREYYQLESLWADAPVVHRGGETQDASASEECIVDLPWPG